MITALFVGVDFDGEAWEGDDCGRACVLNCGVWTGADAGAGADIACADESGLSETLDFGGRPRFRGFDSSVEDD